MSKDNVLASVTISCDHHLDTNRLVDTLKATPDNPEKGFICLYYVAKDWQEKMNLHMVFNQEMPAQGVFKIRVFCIDLNDESGESFNVKGFVEGKYVKFNLHTRQRTGWLRFIQR